MQALALADGTAENEHVFIRGNHKTLGEEVPRRFLEVLGGAHRAAGDWERSAGTGPTIGLARQSAGGARDRQSALAPSLRRGHRPLGRRFRRHGPAAHASRLARLPGSRAGARRLVAQAPAPLDGAVDHVSHVEPLGPSAPLVDPQNKLWHRRQVRRLEAEAIRDAMLAVSGRLGSQRCTDPA